MTSALLQNDRLLRVAINAQLLPGQGSGGVEQVLIGLIHALGKLDDSPEEYIIIGPWQEPDWLDRYLGPNQRVVRGPKSAAQSFNSVFVEPFKLALGPIRPLAAKVRRGLFPPNPASSRLWPEVSVSDGFYEGLGCQVIHFPYQAFLLCAIPAIFNPHDLQHLHFPQFFPPARIAWREAIYPKACHLAHTVVVASHWIKQDLLRHYCLDADKVQVIPWAPPTEAYKEPTGEVLRAVQQKYCLKLPFAFYPAVTFEHKNHVRLLEALALLRDSSGVIVSLVCSGGRFLEYWPRIEERIQALGLSDQVQFLGVVSPEELRAVYQMAQFVIVPTLFEAASGPVFEAWRDGAPVACSAVTSLPEQAGDAALLFDPFSVEAIADAMFRMANDETLRNHLIHRGHRRLGDFDWERTAKAYRAIYRRAAYRPLTDEDRWLLNWDWMRDPQAKQEGS